jgi:hypothetical protein
MAVEIKAFGEIKDGAFYPRNSKRYISQLRNAGNVNQALLTIKGANIRTLDQNAYAWVVCTAIADRMQQDGWQITPDDIYYKIEETYCKEQKTNPKTGKSMMGITKLKKQPTDRFHDIIEEVRQGHMNQYPDNYIATPAEHYGLTEEGYDLWNGGTITFAKAKKDYSL